MCVGGGTPQDIKNVIGLRIDEKVGNHWPRQCINYWGATEGKK